MIADLAVVSSDSLKCFVKLLIFLNVISGSVFETKNVASRFCRPPLRRGNNATPTGFDPDAFAPTCFAVVAPTVANVSEAIELTFVRFGVVSLGLCF